VVLSGNRNVIGCTVVEDDGIPLTRRQRPRELLLQLCHELFEDLGVCPAEKALVVDNFSVRNCHYTRHRSRLCRVFKKLAFSGNLPAVLFAKVCVGGILVYEDEVSTSHRQSQQHFRKFTSLILRSSKHGFRRSQVCFSPFGANKGFHGTTELMKLQFGQIGVLLTKNDSKLPCSVEEEGSLPHHISYGPDVAFCDAGTLEAWLVAHQELAPLVAAHKFSHVVDVASGSLHCPLH
jgi:hypothetical protein